MFRSLVSLMTLLAMLLHAWMGCCWHHAHAHPGDCPEHPGLLETVSHSHGSVCPHHGDHQHLQNGKEQGEIPQTQSQEPNSPRHNHHDCDEGTCQYLAGNILKVPAPADGQGSLDWLPALSSPLAQRIAGLHGACWRADAKVSSAAKPHVRALTQVWLL
jgi:hypothetical protein